MGARAPGGDRRRSTRANGRCAPEHCRARRGATCRVAQSSEAARRDLSGGCGIASRGADLRGGLPAGALAPGEAEAGRPGSHRAVRALRARKGAGECIQRVERPHRPAAPLRGPGTLASGGRRGGDGGGRGLPPRDGIRHATDGRGRDRDRSALHVPHEHGEHSRRDPLSDDATGMTRLELSIAWRYLRSRRDSKLFSLISVIAIGGVIVGVSALIVIIGVMNGLQKDLREKILIGSPDVRVLTYGEDLSMSGWDSVLTLVERIPGVVAAAPFVHTQAGIRGRTNYNEGVFVMGIVPSRPGLKEVTSIRRTAKGGDFTFKDAHGGTEGVVLGTRLANRLNAVVADSVTLISLGSVKASPVTGTLTPIVRKYEV